MNETQQLRDMSNEKLEEEKKNTMFLIMGCNKKFTNPKIKVENRGRLKRRVAKINTILREINAN
jgi:ribosomal protein L29